MKSDCCFDECKDCLNKEYNDKLLGCATNRLSLAFHKLFKEIPIINRFTDDCKHCNWYEKESEHCEELG